MGRVLNFYLDDSGTRHPDHKCNGKRRDCDYFALGGILLAERDESDLRNQPPEFLREMGSRSKTEVIRLAQPDTDV